GVSRRAGVGVSGVAVGEKRPPMPDRLSEFAWGDGSVWTRSSRGSSPLQRFIEVPRRGGGRVQERTPRGSLANPAGWELCANALGERLLSTPLLRQSIQGGLCFLTEARPLLLLRQRLQHLS